MNQPIPTPVYRMVHIDNLTTLLKRGGLHSTNHTPNDGLPYRTIHNAGIQNKRHLRAVTCGPGGTMHDYIPFYFGYLSPMLLQLKTGQVEGYNEGQSPIIYLKSTIQVVVAAGRGFVFSDGQGIKAFTQWYGDLNQLSSVDWDMVYQRYWADNVNDMDRQRRKQAEFLVYEFCPWSLIQEIGVLNAAIQARVQTALNDFDPAMRPPVNVRSGWFY